MTDLFKNISFNNISFELNTNKCCMFIAGSLPRRIADFKKNNNNRNWRFFLFLLAFFHFQSILLFNMTENVDNM